MNILEKIVADKKDEISQNKIDFPEVKFEGQLTKSDRSFKQALQNDINNHGNCFILECKKASPSKGLIRANFDVAEICQSYKQFASCVSVLTDIKYFQGDFDRINQVKELLPQPVLCKDFFVDVYQVKKARFYGANAILLMLSVLDDQQYMALAEEAANYGLDILTEVSNEQEMHRAVALKADIIGINNRNLRDLSTDLECTPKLVALFNELSSEEQQQNTIVISESGIYHHQQVQYLNQFADGYLVGSSLMAQDDLTAACQKLIIGEAKVCGITSVQDAQNAINAGANFLGLIFVDSSPRAVSINQANDLVASVKNANWVTVVRDLPISEVVNLAKQLTPYAIQLHGNEDERYRNQLKQSLTDAQLSCEIWQAVAIENSLPQTLPKVDRIVLDSVNKQGQFGGTGEKFDWSILENLPLDTAKIMLAGGVAKSNIAGIKSLSICGVDVNSGVESAPGQKDQQKLTSFFQAFTKRKQDKD